MFYDGSRLLAVLPAHLSGDKLCSHNGLTYGGLLMNRRLTVVQTLHLFRELNGYLRAESIRHVSYKCIPWIYHRLSAEEDLYALYHECRARIVTRDFATNIFLSGGMRWDRIRRRGVIRAQKAGVSIECSDDYSAFWKILTQNLLSKYSVSPVHTLQEIELLHSRFPENIRLYQAVRDGEVLGGVVLYVSFQVVHAQYSSATPEGKKMGVIDLLYNRIKSVATADTIAGANILGIMLLELTRGLAFQIPAAIQHTTDNLTKFSIVKSIDLTQGQIGNHRSYS